MKDMITPMRDVKGNNMLHLVGKSASRKRRLQDVSGVALQMQRELLWFKEHKELVTLGERWMKEMANQCMVVATLIATIVFAAAFTVPAGYGQNSGHPFFQSKATFIVFDVADAISLFSSTTSILIFLSILTSRYAERDFLVSLPKKLIAVLLYIWLQYALFFDVIRSTYCS
nr:hypothetical protein [Tanacetum cinerariifolium]